jgi:hypothetical protein
VPIEVEVEPPPAVAPPTPSVEAEPEPDPDPLADEPPVPSVVEDEPEPAVEPPAPIVDDDDCACANAMPAATIVDASAAVRMSLSVILNPPLNVCLTRNASKGTERFDAAGQRQIVSDVPANHSKSG